MSHKKEHTVMVYKVLQELARQQGQTVEAVLEDRKSTRLNSSHRL